jgi:diguanylate cyclase (GGDEF)-like protein
MPNELTDEGARLAAVRDTGLVEAQHDVQLERLNKLATELLGVPVSLVSLVDEDRQFFPGEVGLSEPWASFGETPLSHSFCKHVVEHDAPLVIEDARADPLVEKNLAVRDLGVIAYAGVPLRLSDGEVLGSFCAIDGKPHRWSDHDLEVLADLAELARGLIEARRNNINPGLHDPLTGLPDRAVFAELVERASDRGSRSARCTSVIAVGLDGFRLINEALGHAAGDEVLRSVATRLQEAVRGNDVACRLAGDVFLVLCESASDEADALLVAQRLRRAVIDEPLRIRAREQQISATVGVACSDAHADSGELTDSALASLAAAKRGTDSATRGLSPKPRADAARRLLIRNDVALAHERDELAVVYQPVVDLHTGRVAKVEALVRWGHPELGRIGPEEFIPAAESSGAIVPLGEWVLRRAIKDFCSWRSIGRDGELTLAVNVAPLQLRTANFVEIVQSALDTCSIPGSALTLEITERTLLDERVMRTPTLKRLRELGIKLALDDFGTGYSALGYLSRVQVDVIKIDRSFTATINTDAGSATLVRGILALSRGLKLRSVVEGIETEEQLAAVREMGCDYGQGYLLGRPVEEGEIARLLGK